MRLLALASITTISLACGGSDKSPSTDGAPGGDGSADANGLPFVCNPASDDNPEGLKSITYLDSSESVYPEANWRVAVEPETQVNWATFPGAQPFESAMLFDRPDSGIELAGFLVSRGAASQSALQELDLAQAAILALLPNVTLNVRLSGTNIRSLDGFDTVVASTIEVRTSGTMDATRVRELLVPPLLGRLPDDVTFPDVGWSGGSDTRFILTLQTLYRADADQTVFMGSFARAYDFDDRHRATSVYADDLANGTGLTESLNSEARECNSQILDKQAISDIIWVMDESGSMDGVRDAIAENAVVFFEEAVARGLDFRMGVTDMNDTNLGRFASRDTAEGDGERWLMPDEHDAFGQAILDPSGPAGGDFGSEHGLTQMKAALERHLPRDAADAFKVRPDARLVVMILGDEEPEEFRSISGLKKDAPTPEQEEAITTMLQPHLDLVLEVDATVHVIHNPLPYGSVCSGDSMGYGYYDLANATEGQIGDVCQEDLHTTMDVIIDDIVGDASPVTLEYVPISSTITVMRDGEPVPRSRERGWDYRASANSIIFYGMPIDPANPADIVVGYRRWKEQVVE